MHYRYTQTSLHPPTYPKCNNPVQLPLTTCALVGPTFLAQSITHKCLSFNYSTTDVQSCYTFFFILKRQKNAQKLLLIHCLFCCLCFTSAFAFSPYSTVAIFCYFCRNYIHFVLYCLYTADVTLQYALHNNKVPLFLALRLLFCDFLNCSLSFSLSFLSISFCSCGHALLSVFVHYFSLFSFLKFLRMRFSV